MVGEKDSRIRGFKDSSEINPPQDGEQETNIEGNFIIRNSLFDIRNSFFKALESLAP
jgi:hypothetical protein